MMARAKSYNKIKPGTDLNIVLMKALTRYQEGRLSKPMKMWIEEVLELNQNQIT